ncbi:hypothetical protein [Streptomyces sp. CA-106131]|uniref:hypothetical protein n=1 Tax=Streptomyces sp. CA-106131 TaxID=3240045 RepID=UPI003D903CEE
MTENIHSSADGSSQYTGTGSENDPIVPNIKPQARDQVKAAIASLGADVDSYAAAFRSAADLSASLPADVRKIVSDASSAITGTVATAHNARIKADGFLADVRLYPEGRQALAGEAIKDAQDKVSESLADADVRLKIAESELYEAARPKLPQAEAMTARADLEMVTRRQISSPGALTDTLKSLAAGGDSVAALVADSAYLGRFLDAQGVESDVRDAILTSVQGAVVKAAAESGDAKRMAAGRTSLALVELRKARAVAASYTRHKLNGK